MSAATTMRRLVAVAVLVTAFVAIAAAPQRAASAERRTPVVAAIERARPAVVNIAAEQVITLRSDPFFEEFFGRFFEQRPREQQYKRRSLGSGILVRPDGYVVTNAHVVARGSEIKVVLADEREFEAKVVGADEDADLAVLKIEGTNLPHIGFGASNDLMIGETVIAIGNPFGFSHTVTTGVVSAVGRSLQTENRTYLDFVQTDASINPGNSGGPLLNIEGDLIGINTAIYGNAENIGFAIPAARANKVVQDLIRFGEVRRGFVGLHVQDLTPELAGALGAGETRGVVVREVERPGPASDAGVAVGDVVVEVDHHGVRSRLEFDERVAMVGEGARLDIAVRRGSESRTFQLVASAMTGEHLDSLAWRRLGLRVREAPDKSGVAIAEVRKTSHAARAGVRPGQRLLTVGSQTTETVDAYRKAIGGLRGSQPIPLTVRQGNATYRLTLPGDD